MKRGDSIGDRMKGYYENIPKTRLVRRLPVIIRVDGKAFHTFLKGFKKPFDEILIEVMDETSKYLCKNIMGAKLAYVQSDEISILLTDYDRLNTEAYFNYEVEKICSVVASMATLAFNKNLARLTEEFATDVLNIPSTYNIEEERKYIETLRKAVDRGALFDARCFNIPKEEVTNYFYWRQLDASRNSIQLVGHAYFSDAELYKKSCNEIQDMLVLNKGVNWNNYATYQKRGRCIVKNRIVVGSDSIIRTAVLRDISQSESAWIIDSDIPIFKGEGREYIDRLVFIGEE